MCSHLFSVLLVVACALPLSHAQDKLTIQLHNQIISQAIPPNFASFSLEIGSFIHFVGSPPKPTFLQLLENLRAPSGCEGPVLRVGGNSADDSWWNPAHLPNPPNVTYSITDADLTAYGSFLQAAPHSQLVIDTSLYQAGNASWAVAHIRALQQRIGFDGIAAVEIGNECDLFMHNGLRPPTYSYKDYSNEFKIYAQALLAETDLPARRIQGGTFCCGHFDGGISDYLNTYTRFLTSFSYHAYPQTACNGHVPHLDDLMDNTASDGVALRMKPFVTTALSLDIAYVMGETNSVSCGGYAGISDVFASALWALDYFFALAATNISMANLHGGGAQPYSPINFLGPNASTPDVRPLYYAMLVFSEATANASVVLSASVASTHPRIKAWAVRDADGQQRVVVIHKALNQTQHCTVTVTASHGDTAQADATLLRLHVPDGDYSSKHGVVWAGQTFDGSTDGRPVGVRAGESVPAAAEGWTFSLAPGTAAVLLLPPSSE